MTRDPTFLQLFYKMVCNVFQERLFGEKLIPEILEGGHQLFGDALGEVWWNREQLFFHCGGFSTRIGDAWTCSLHSVQAFCMRAGYLHADGLWWHIGAVPRGRS